MKSPNNLKQGKKIFVNVQLDRSNCFSVYFEGKIGEEFKEEFKSIDDIKAKLGDLAPTILKYLDIEKPEEMTGEVLIK